MSSGMKRHIFFLIFIVLCSVFVEVISIALLVPFFSVLYDYQILLNNASLITVFPNLSLYEKKDIVFIVTTMFVLSILISTAIKVLAVWFQSYLAFKMGARLTSKLYENVLMQPYEFFLNRNSSELVSTIYTKSNTVTYGVIFSLISILANSIFVLIIVLFLFLFNYTLSLYIFSLIFAAYFFITYLFKDEMMKISTKINAEMNNSLRYLNEGFGGVRDVIINDDQIFYLDVFSKSDAGIRKLQAKSAVTSLVPRNVVESIATLILVAVSYYFFINNMFDYAVVAALVTIVMAAQKILPAAQQIYYAITQIRTASGSLGDVVSLLELSGGIKNNDQVVMPVIFDCKITVDNLHYRYHQSNKDTLRQVNIVFRKGDRIAIIGPSGAGKSTFCDLLMGLLTPTDGVIRVDDVALDPKSIISWRKLIAHVSQETFIFDKSIAENITLQFDGEAVDADRLNQAVKNAGLCDFVNELPNGCQTVLGERGSKLSGGQKQRIGIARALYKKSQVIFFDETTSALDAKAESLIMQTICNLDASVTVFFITHKTSILDGFNRVIKVNNGLVTIVEDRSEGNPLL